MLIVDEKGFTRWAGPCTEKHTVIWQWPDTGHLYHQKDIYGTKQHAEAFATEMRAAGAINIKVS